MTEWMILTSIAAQLQQITVWFRSIWGPCWCFRLIYPFTTLITGSKHKTCQLGGEQNRVLNHRSLLAAFWRTNMAISTQKTATNLLGLRQSFSDLPVFLEILRRQQEWPLKNGKRFWEGTSGTFLTTFSRTMTGSTDESLSFGNIINILNDLLYLMNSLHRNKTSSWFQLPLKNMLVKLDDFFKCWGENKQYLKWSPRKPPENPLLPSIMAQPWWWWWWWCFVWFGKLEGSKGSWSLE